MADLHRAITNGPFGYFPYNIPVGSNKMPLDPAAIPDVPKQIKVSLNIEVEDKEKEISFFIVPCSGEAVEEFLLYTWDQYSKSTAAKLPANLRKDGPTHFRFFPLCLGVAATTIWHKVLEENGVNAIDEDGTNDTTHKNFMTCVKFFCEELANVTYLGDVIIRFLRHAKKPALMAPDACFRRRQTLLAYFDSGLLRSRLARPTAYELAEAVFLAFPRGYQEKYAETHEELDADTSAMKSAFMQFYATDVRNGTLEKLKSGKSPKKRPAEDKGRSSDKHRRTSRRSPKRHGRRGRDYRDRRDHNRPEDRERRDDRGRDDRRDNRNGNGDYKNKRPFKKEHVNHVSDEREGSDRDDSSRSRSSRSSGGSDRERDTLQEEEDNYAMSIDKAKDPNIPEEFEYSDEDKSRHDSYYHERDFSSRGKRWTSFLKRGGGGKKKSSSASEPRK